MERYGDIAEYVSRPARMRLVELCLAEIEKRLEIERKLNEIGGKKGRPVAATSVLAERMNVTIKTVRRWRKDVFQAKNMNVKLLLATALELDKEGMRKILRDDFRRHRQELLYFIDIEDEPEP